MAYFNGTHTAINITVNGVDLPENTVIPVIIEATLDENGVYNATLDNYTQYKAGDVFFVKCQNEQDYSTIKGSKLHLKVNGLEAIPMSIQTFDSGVFIMSEKQFYAHCYEDTNGAYSFFVVSRVAAELASGGNAELTGDSKPYKGEVNNYTELPTEATEGDIYYCNNYYSDFDINSIIFNDITQSSAGSLNYVKEGCIKGEDAGNLISYFESTINGFSIPHIGEKNDYLFNDEYVCFIRRANSDLNSKYYYNALQVYKYSVSCIDDYEGGTDIIRSMYYTDVYNAEYLRNADVEYLNAKITQSAAWDWGFIPKSQINEYPKGAYMYSLGKWVHM